MPVLGFSPADLAAGGPNGPSTGWKDSGLPIFVADTECIPHPVGCGGCTLAARAMKSGKKKQTPAPCG